MSNDRVTSVYNLSVITAFVEHTHIQTKNVGKIYSTVCTTFIRTNRHHMFTVDLKILYLAKKTFDELISWWDCLKSTQRNRIWYTRVMSIKSDNIVNSHTDKLLKRKCAVKRFTGSSLMLTAFIKEWHNNVNTASLTTYSSNDSL